MLNTGYPGDAKCYTVPLKGLGHTTKSLVELCSPVSFQAKVQGIKMSMSHCLG